MTNWKPVGVLSIISGVTALIGIIGIIPVLLITPIGFVSGAIAIYKKQKLIGWVGISINAFALVTVLVLLYGFGWLGID